MLELVVPAALAAVVLVPLLIVARYAVVNLASALYKHFFTALGAIPEPPLPLLRRVTLGHDLVRLFVTLNSLDVAAQFAEWRDAYGSMYIVRGLFGTPTVICMSVDAVRRATLEAPRKYWKTEEVRRAFASLVGHKGILLAEGVEHDVIRRAVAPALHHEALKKVDGVFRAEGKRLCSQLEAAGEELDIFKEAGTATFRVIARACFGESALSEYELFAMRQAYLASLSESPSQVFRREILQNFLGFLNPYWFDNNKREKRYLHDMISKLCKAAEDTSPSHVSAMDRNVDDVTAEDVPQSRLLSLMVDEDTKRKVTHRQMVETVMSFMAAGQETTSMSLSWTLYLLCKHPEWQSRLREELDNRWTEKSSQEELDSLRVMHLIVKESLRLYPPGHFVGRTLAESDVMNGVELPKGTNIMLPILAIHRDEQAWGPDASEFRPNRFLPAEEAKRSCLLWCPFLFGPRGCIGQRFAMLEMKTFIAQIISRLEVFVDESKDPPPHVVGYLGRPRNMRLYVRPRPMPSV